MSLVPGKPPSNLSDNEERVSNTQLVKQRFTRTCCSPGLAIFYNVIFILIPLGSIIIGSFSHRGNNCSTLPSHVLWRGSVGLMCGAVITWKNVKKFYKQKDEEDDEEKLTTKPTGTVDIRLLDGLMGIPFILYFISAIQVAYVVFKLTIVFKERGELPIVYAQCGKFLFDFTFGEVVTFFVGCVLFGVYYIIVCAQVNWNFKDK